VITNNQNFGNEGDLNYSIMEAKNGNLKLWLSILRWTARIVAVLIVAFFLFMFIGEGLNGRPVGSPKLVARDYFLLSMMALFNVGLLIGLWREGLGGLISLVFMSTTIIFHQIEGITPVIFYITLFPGILYILSWYFHRNLVHKSGPSE
jgi:hypothetical protein